MGLEFPKVPLPPPWEITFNSEEEFEWSFLEIKWLGLYEHRNLGGLALDTHISILKILPTLQSRASGPTVEQIIGLKRYLRVHLDVIYFLVALNHEAEASCMLDNTSTPELHFWLRSLMFLVSDRTII